MNFDIKITRSDVINLYTTALLNYEDSCIDVDMPPALLNILKNGFKGFGHMTNTELANAWEWISTGDVESDMDMLSDFVHIAGLTQVLGAMGHFWNDAATFDQEGNCLYKKIQMRVY